MPTISPERTVRFRPSRAASPRSSGQRRSCTWSSTSPTSRAGGRSVATGEAPTMRLASSVASVSATNNEAATVRPPRSTVASSQKPVTSWSLWLMNTTVRPSSAMCRSTAPSSSASPGVRTAVGSSSTKIRASRHNALRISTRWRSPIESCHTGRSGSVARPNRSASAPTADSTADLRTIRSHAPSATFSATVNDGTRRNSWWTMPTPASNASAGVRKWRGVPSIRTSPSSGRYTPDSTFMRVDLPAPFSPSTA